MRIDDAYPKNMGPLTAQFVLLYLILFLFTLSTSSYSNGSHRTVILIFLLKRTIKTKNANVMMASILPESVAPSEVDPPPSPAAEKVAEVSAVVIIVKDEVAARADAAKGGKKRDDLLDERVCRICHLSPDRSLDLEHEEKGLDPDLILIGCGCKNELGTAHRYCAETWFRLKGNRSCEICGKNAKNITGDEDGSFIEGWHGNRIQDNNGNNSRNIQERASCWRGQPLCNFLMACLIIAFILPWFFRVNMF